VPEVRAGRREVAELRDPGREPPARLREHTVVVELAERGQPQRLIEERLQRRLQPAVIPRSDHVHGHALQRRDHDATPRHVSGQLGAVEVAEPRPEPEVRSVRILRLEAGEQADRRDGREVGTFEEQLPRKRRAVQFTRGQGQTTILPNLFPARKRS
jgi:hypothetical protein